MYSFYKMIYAIQFIL